MRIVRLDLLAFGPFTDQVLEFGDRPGLHIVHGPNEAGKSSALRALRSLLYGIAQQTPDNFLHSYQHLRIGGDLQAADGARLEIIRRKGRTKTLRGPDDAAVVDEKLLQRLLGGVDEATFSQRFGIDYDELRRGGESVVCGGGDLGEMLFAAGAGVADLREIQQRLEAEADALFKPRGSNQRIALALNSLEQTRREIRDTQLPTRQWVEHDRAVRQAEQRQREIDEELNGKRAERSRLDRIRQSLPMIGQLNLLRRTLDEIADAPLLHEGFSADRREAETCLANAQRAAKKAREEIQRLDDELGRVEVPVELLAHRTAITQWHAALGSYQKAARDRPGLVADRARAQQQAQLLLRQLGRPEPLERVEALRLPRVHRKRIQELAVDCKALFEKQQSTARAVRDVDAQIRQIDEELAQLPPQRSVVDLERTIRHVQKHGDLDAHLRTARAELERSRGQANVSLARLPQFDGTLAVLEQLPVPSVETIDRFEKELADADQEIRRHDEKADELTAAGRDLRAKLDALRLEGEVPTESDLDQARQRRDAAWELVQQVWRDGRAGEDPAVAALVEEFAPGGDLGRAFRASIDKADAVADRLRREADRVALKARLTAELQTAESALNTVHEVRQSAARERDRLRTAWQSQWTPAGIEPLTPREMRRWREQQQELREIAADLREREANVARLQEQIGLLKRDLNHCLDGLNQPHVPDEEPLATALERCQQIAEQIRSDNQHRQRLTDERNRLERQRPHAQQEADDAQIALDQWRADWTEAVAPLGLGGDAQPSDANAVIETVDDVLQRVDEARALDERIEGIDRDARTFKQAVQQLLRQVAPDLLDTFESSVEDAVADLVDRLHQAEKDQTKVQSWQEQRQEHQAALANAQSEIAQWQETLERLCGEAFCRSPDELPRVEQRAKTRRDAETELRGFEQSLSELAAPTPLDEWIDTAGQFNSDQVEAGLHRLDEQLKKLEREMQNVSEALGEHRNELSRMDGSGRAAEARNQAEHLLASIRSDAEEYIRKRLASAVLSRAMERYRQESQGPVLSRASELFSALTLGSFAGLRADYDDDGNAVLVGVRPAGQTVSVAGMSDGTCDQLYLALRLALLESSLDGREPLPFIVDDVLIKFDDERAAAALMALARLSEKTQVIFFTHHEHVVEIARETLDRHSLCVHQLNGSVTPSTARTLSLAAAPASGS